MGGGQLCHLQLYPLLGLAHCALKGPQQLLRVLDLGQQHLHLFGTVFIAASQPLLQLIPLPADALQVFLQLPALHL